MEFIIWFIILPISKKRISKPEIQRGAKAKAGIIGRETGHDTESHLVVPWVRISPGSLGFQEENPAVSAVTKWRMVLSLGRPPGRDHQVDLSGTKGGLHPFRGDAFSNLLKNIQLPARAPEQVHSAKTPGPRFASPAPIGPEACVPVPSLSWTSSAWARCSTSKIQGSPQGGGRVHAHLGHKQKNQ